MKKLIAALIAAAMSLVLFAGCAGGSAGYAFYDYDLTEYVTTGEFKGIEIKAADIEVSDDEVLQTIRGFLVENDIVSKMPVTDRAVENGDFVNIDYEGFHNGTAFDGGTASGAELEIGSGSFIDGFEQGLVGAQIGETRSLPLTFPEEYPSSPELAGEDVIFNVKVNSIQAYSYPEINAEFMTKYFPDYSGVSEFLADVKASCVDEKKMDIVSDRILSSATVIKYPEKELNSFTDELRGKYQNYADSLSVSMEEFLLKYMKMSTETFEEQVTQYSQEQLKAQMVCISIARSEGIELSDDEFDDYCEYYASQYSYSDADECLEKCGSANITVWGLVDTVIQQAVDSCVII